MKYKLLNFNAQTTSRYIVAGNTVLVTPLYYESFLSQKKNAPNTIKNNLSKLNCFFNWCNSLNINIDNRLKNNLVFTDSELHQFYHSLIESNLSPANTNAILLIVRKFLIWCVNNGISNVSPKDKSLLNTRIEEIFSPVKSHKKKEIKVIDKPNIKVIYEFMKNNCNPNNPNYQVHLRNYIIFAIGYYFGLRLGEVLSLEISDVSITDELTVNIRRNDERKEYSDLRTTKPSPKTQSRILNLTVSKYLIQALENYLLNIRPLSKPQNNYLFVSITTGNALSVSSVQKVVKKISNKCNIGLNYHMLRHTIANDLYKNILKKKDKEYLIEQMLYFFGWTSRESLIPYAQKAIKDEASRLIKKYQQDINDELQP